MTRAGPASLPDDDSALHLPLVRMLPQARPPTKAERTFQQLVDSIAHTREELTTWQAYELRYHRRVAGEIEPLEVQLHKTQRQMVELIDKLLSPPAGSHRLGRAHRAKLSQILLELVGNLLELGHDEALVALHDRYSDVSREEAQRSELAMAQSLLNDVFGLDVGDDHGASTTEELLQHAQRKLEERAGTGEHQGDDESAGSDAGPANPKRDAARARRAQAAKDASQSLRDIYRKLASALHPDREQDAQARQRKTLLMQRVNQAYDAKDLLTLLGLQLEIEQIDASHLSSLTPKRLAHYNKVLQEQLAELDAELARFVEPFRRSIGSMAKARLTPAVVDQHLNSSIAQLRLATRQLREDLVAFRNPLLLRDWLEHYEIGPDGDDPRDLEDLMERFAELAPEGRGKTRRRR